jgi:hypothetical protein
MPVSPDNVALADEKVSQNQPNQGHRWRCYKVSFAARSRLRLSLIQRLGPRPPRNRSDGWTSRVKSPPRGENLHAVRICVLDTCVHTRSYRVLEY